MIKRTFFLILFTSLGAFAQERKVVGEIQMDEMSVPPQIFQEVKVSDGFLTVKKDIHDLHDRSAGNSESQSRLILRLPCNQIDSVYKLESKQVAVEYFFGAGLIEYSSSRVNSLDITVTNHGENIRLEGNLILELDPNHSGLETKRINLNVISQGELKRKKQTYTLDPQQAISSIDEQIYQITELEPQYPGGPEEMMKFIKSNIQYPQSAKDLQIQGRVYVSLIIEKDGSISQVEVVRGLTADLDKEARRVVRLMPKWIPGEQDHKTVRSRIYIPILFKIE